MPYTDAERAFIERFTADDEPPNASAPRVGLINLVGQSTRQKSASTMFRLRTVGDTVDDLNSVAKRFTDEFDMHGVELYKWFPVPAVDLPDLELQMARAVEHRIRENILKERAFDDRKQRCIADIRKPDADGKPLEAAREGLDGDVAVATAATVAVAPPPKARIDIPKDAKRIRIKDHEPSGAREQYVVFSFLELEAANAIEGVQFIVKIHGVFATNEEAKDRSDTMHKMMRHKHLETCIGVLDAWLRLPPPDDAPVTYNDEQHDAIYKDRWGTAQQQGIDAVKAFHEERDLAKALEDTSLNGVIDKTPLVDEASSSSDAGWSIV